MRRRSVKDGIPTRERRNELNVAVRHGIRGFRIYLDQSINVTSSELTFFSTSLLVTRYQSSSESTEPKTSSTAVLPITVVPEIR